MSAGNFSYSKYQSNQPHVFPCRVQPETLALSIDGAANTAPAGDVEAGLPTVVLRKSRKGFGVHPRTITVRLTADGTGQTAEYKEGRSYVLPILRSALWDVIKKNDTGTYLGIACIVVSKAPEIVR